MWCRRPACRADGMQPGRLHHEKDAIFMVLLRTAILLTISNTFMTFAGYAHLCNVRGCRCAAAGIRARVVA